MFSYLFSFSNKFYEVHNTFDFLFFLNKFDVFVFKQKSGSAQES